MRADARARMRHGRPDRRLGEDFYYLEEFAFVAANWAAKNRAAREAANLSKAVGQALGHQLREVDQQIAELKAEVARLQALIGDRHEEEGA